MDGGTASSPYVRDILNALRHQLLSLAAKDRNSKDLASFNQRSEASEKEAGAQEEGHAVESFLRDCASILDSFPLESSQAIPKPASTGVACSAGEKSQTPSLDDKKREILRCDCVQCEQLVVVKLLFVGNSHDSIAAGKSKVFCLDDEDDIVDLDLDETFKDVTAESVSKPEASADATPTERYTLSRLQCTCVKHRDTDGTLPLDASNATVPLWHHRNAMVAAIKRCNHVRDVVNTACNVTGEQPQASLEQVPANLHWRWVFGTSSNGGHGHRTFDGTGEPGTWTAHA